MKNVSFTFRPLSGVWPDDGRRSYKSCRFRAGYSVTIGELDTELGRISVYGAVIELDLDERDIRMDGLPRAHAKPASPKVRLSFNHPEIGPLQYPCDTYSHWHDNLRAILKTLEAQRDMDRHGATRHHQQYQGWKQLPGTIQVAMTVEGAAKFIADTKGVVHEAKHILTDQDGYRKAYRRSATIHHPDSGGSHEQFLKLQEATRILDQHHGASK